MVTGKLELLSAKKQVAVATGQKIFRKYFYQNLSR